jgi:hypothetical protein
MTLDRINKLIALNKQCNLLSVWETDFLDSISRQLEKARKLSPKQNDLIQKIESKLTDEAIHAADEWAKTWGSEKQQIAKICAEYYLFAGFYFKDLAKQVLADPEWVMPQASFERMCHNKYATKIITASQAKPEFSPGAMVALRDNALRRLGYRFNKYVGVPLFVLEVLEKVTNAAKGTKRYKVLPSISMEVLEVEERDIKKFRKGKKTKKSNATEDIVF